MTLRTRKILAGGFAALIVWGLIVIVFSPIRPDRLEGRLQSAAEAALDAREHDWARVVVRGQTAILSGAAPNLVARDDALAAVRASTWTGGVVSGGITQVRDETSQARFERRFAFRADAANGRVFIRGDASDDDTRRAVEAFAQERFPIGAESDLTLIPGGAASAEWQSVAQLLLAQLARFDRGALVIQGEQAALIAEAPNAQTARSSRAALAELPEPYQMALLIRSSGQVFSSIETAQGCDAVLQAARGANQMRFEPAGAAPSPVSQTALLQVGRAFSHCPENLSLGVNIQPETTPSDDTLSRRRAAAVRSLLVQGGAEDARITVAIVENQSDRVMIRVLEEETAS
ncbi:hypothetical protein RMQ97_13435 [Maricaulis sp. D1M11]|uniref:hypothetical protein n=1 Tax=Maricaulis sp. D1M11 TaxID=3076117 RepID=UPI0039B6A85A